MAWWSLEVSRTDQLSKCLETGWSSEIGCKQGNLSKCSGQRAGEVDFSVPQIATEELRIALRLQTLVLPMWLQGFC